jgi:prevent-host-death family protein
MQASAKFSEDIVPLGDLKVNPGPVVIQVDKTHRPVLITKRGRGAVIVQPIDSSPNWKELPIFQKAVVLCLRLVLLVCRKLSTRLFVSYLVSVKPKFVLFESGEASDYSRGHKRRPPGQSSLTGYFA